MRPLLKARTACLASRKLPDFVELRFTRLLLARKACGLAPGLTTLTTASVPLRR